MTFLITPSRLIIIALIVSTLLFLRPDQIRDPRLTRNKSNSFVPVPRDKQNIDQGTRARIEHNYGKLPMRFEANQGQADRQVKFTARGAGYAFFLTGDEAVLNLRKAGADQPVKSTALRMKLVGSNRSSRVAGIDKLLTKSNYFIGNDPAAWGKKISNYSRVKYESVYPGIDLIWYGNQQMLEHDFIIAPSADPSLIKISFSGTDAMSIDGEGALVLRAEGEELRLLKPHAWQESNGNRQTIACNYRLGKSNQIEFQLGDYDQTLPLVIDPVLIYSTFIGGIGSETGLDIAIDGEGAVYLSGSTSSVDFPGPSPIQPALANSTDAFVLKINPAGNAIVFGTWIGGAGTDSASEVSVDLEGNVYLGGMTASSNFPLKNPIQGSRLGLQDAFAAKLDASGSTLLYSTYIGGTGGLDSATDIAIDADGNLCLTGTTDSRDFPVVNAFQPVKNGSGAYASENGGESWSERKNGLAGANANDIVIFPGNSSILFAGTDHGAFRSDDGGSSWTLLGSDERNFTRMIVNPTTPEILYAISSSQLFKSSDGGATWTPKPIPVPTPNTPVRALAIDPAAPSKLYAGTASGLWISADAGESWTFIVIPPVAGSTIGPVDTIAIDPISSAKIYIGTSQGIFKSVDGGATWAFAGDGLPVTAPPATPVRILRIAISSSNPAIIYALADNQTIYKTTDAGVSWLSLSTPAIGPPAFSDLTLPLTVAPDNPQIAFVGSRSNGIFRTVDGGITWGAVNNGMNSREIRSLVIDSTAPGIIYAGTYSSSDVFLVKLDKTGSAFIYSSYLGGGATEVGGALALDSAGSVYLTGLTNSPNFPVVNPFQPATTGLPDAFVAKVDASGSAVLWATYLGGSSFEQGVGIAVSAKGEIFVAGTTTSNDFPVNKALQPSPIGNQDAFITKLKNDGSALDFSTYLGGTSIEIANAIALDSAGNPYITGSSFSNDFPVINAVQSTRGGNPAVTVSDAFVTKLNNQGSALLYSTYLGGNFPDNGNSIAVDLAGNAYVTGNTFSSDFPTTPFPIRPLGSGNEAFVTKIGARADLAISLTGTLDPVMIFRHLTYSLVITNNGPDPAIGVRVTDTLPPTTLLTAIATSQGTCKRGREINCALCDLAAGESAEITISVRPFRTGTIANLASVTSATADINTANNTASLETTVSLLPSIYGRVTKTGGAGLNGVSVAVDGSGKPPALTSDNGKYQVSELAVGGRYTVTPSLQGYVFSPASRTIRNLHKDRQVDFGAVACNLIISPDSQSFPAAGGQGSVTITSPDPRCPWTATTDVPWIRFISATAGNGNATVSYQVEPATGSRAGTIRINDTRVTVFQEFNACNTVTFNTPKVFSLTGLSDPSMPANLITEDFNNDSVSDLVLYITQPEAGLSIALSNSSGGYADANQFYTGGVRTIRAGDLNNDGINDLALITNEEPGRLTLLYGNGAGGFSGPVTLDSGPSPTSLAIADFNNDGRADLAVGTASLNPEPIPGSYNLAIHLGDGAGGFTALRNIGFTTSPGSFPSQIEAGDFNGDATRDLVIMGSLGSAIIFTGDGSGGFTTSTLSNVIRPGLLAVGDFNGDLKTDLAISQSELFGATTLLNFISTTSGTLQLRQSLNISFQVIVSAADLNGDGKSDLLLRGDGNIRVLYGNNEGNFTRPEIYLPGGSPGLTALGDFKKDGRDLQTDLFVIIQPPLFTSSPTVKVGIMTSDSLQGFNAPRAFSYDPLNQPTSDSTGFDLESGDLNGDGVLDLAIVPSGLPGVVIMYGDGSGRFGDPVSISTGPFARASSVELRDFNSDGKLDLAVLNASSNLVILLNNGQGEFTQSATLNATSFATGIETADFNKDGNLDLVAKGQSGGLSLFLGNGQGGFTESTTGIGGNLISATFTSGDFNGDGNSDLAISDNQRFFDNELVILFGNGHGEFGQPVTISTGTTLGFLFAVDLNLDGRDDLVYQAISETTITVALSYLGGSFSAPVRYPVGSSVRMATSGDANGDGKLDLITISNIEGTISTLLGNGDGSFNQPASSPVTNSLTNLVTGDFDKDGSIDIAIVRNGGSIVGILRNRSICFPQQQ